MDSKSSYAHSFPDKNHKSFYSILNFYLCKCIQKAFEYNSISNEKSKASYSLRGIGKSFAYRYHSDSALYYYLSAYKLIPQIKDSNEIANIYNNLANTYSRLNNYDSALNCIKKAILFNKDTAKIYNHYLTKAGILIANHQYDSATIYLKKALLVIICTQKPDAICNYPNSPNK